MAATPARSLEPGAVVPHAWGRTEPAVLGAFLGDAPGGVRRFAHVQFPRSLSWLVYERAPRWYETQDGAEAGRPVTVAEPIHKGSADPWPGRAEVQCHRTDPRHPWNENEPRPGHHRCLVCGALAFIEFHGVADGQCQHCGHGG